jgi:hypothetical protein
MPDKQLAAPENTAVRVALWRALHVELDAPPHLIEDEVGLQLVAPEADWRSRPDMSPFTRPFRASIVARARFVEDLVAERVAHGVDQYVILGAGLDTFAQRRPELASRLRVFEIDQPGPQASKRQRLIDLGLGVPSFLQFVPVDFEAGDPWWERLAAAGFDSGRPALVASTGVTLGISKRSGRARASIKGHNLLSAKQLDEGREPTLRAGSHAGSSRAPGARRSSVLSPRAAPTSPGGKTSSRPSPRSKTNPALHGPTPGSSQKSRIASALLR